MRLEGEVLDSPILDGHDLSRFACDVRVVLLRHTLHPSRESRWFDQESGLGYAVWAVARLPQFRHSRAYVYSTGCCASRRDWAMESSSEIKSEPSPRYFGLTPSRGPVEMWGGDCGEFTTQTLKQSDGSRLAVVTGLRLDWGPCVLTLPHEYPDFLSELGWKTRKNIRWCRNRARSLGFTFDVGHRPRDADQRRSIGKLTLPSGVSRHRIDAVDRAVRATPGGFQADVLTSNGMIVSSVSGYISGDRAAVLSQVNDSTYSSLGISLLARSLLIEYLVSRGVSLVLFEGGMAGALRDSAAAVTIPGRVVCGLDPTSRWRWMSLARRSPSSPIGQAYALWKSSTASTAGAA